MKIRPNQSERGELLAQVIEAVYNSQNDPEELVLLLEITVEDLVERFGDKLEEHCEKFGVYNYWDDIFVDDKEHDYEEVENLYYEVPSTTDQETDQD